MPGWSSSGTARTAADSKGWPPTLPPGAVRFTGELPREEVGRWMYAADALALCSGYEGLSHVLLEAMAAGLPVLVSDVGGNRALVQDGHDGLIVPYGDVEATRRGLAALLTDGDARPDDPTERPARRRRAHRRADGRPDAGRLPRRRWRCRGAVRLLLITPKVDPNDDLFGHVNGWATALARRVERLYVVALWPGHPCLPANARFATLG